MDGQQLLTRRWRSLSWWGRKHFTFFFAYKGRQYFVYDYVEPVAPQITQVTWPKNVDAPLTLIFMMVQEAFHFLFAYTGC